MYSLAEWQRTILKDEEEKESSGRAVGSLRRR